MEPVTFAESNVVIAKDQPPYLPLPAYVSAYETISCWQLSTRDRVRLLFTGRLWLRQCNFGNPLQPQKPSAESPFGLRKLHWAIRLRSRLLLPFDCRWNAFVRDATAALERRFSTR